MTIPIEKKDRAIYHLVLGDLHRLHGTFLNLQTMDVATTAEALREHFTREQGLITARLNEWRGRRPTVYREANEDFQLQVRMSEE